MHMPPNAHMFNADGNGTGTPAPPPIHGEMFQDFDIARIPTLERADLRNPEELALWALMCLPGTESAGAVMLMMESSLRAISQRLSDAGFYLDPDRIKVRYVPPGPDATIWDNGAGYWEPIPDDERDAVVDAVKARMREWGLTVPGDVYDELADARARLADAERRAAEAEAELDALRGADND